MNSGRVLRGPSLYRWSEVGLRSNYDADHLGPIWAEINVYKLIYRKSLYIYTYEAAKQVL
jgi:hypothetical protein